MANRKTVVLEGNKSMPTNNSSQAGANQSLRQLFVDDIRTIINDARCNAVRSVDFSRVQMYWGLGRRIQEEVQQGKSRADYGSYLIRNLAKTIEPEFGSGFGVRQLEQARRFYRTYPIANTLRSQLNWSQYRRLIQIDDPDKREYYELESVNNAWTARETSRRESHNRNIALHTKERHTCTHHIARRQQKHNGLGIPVVSAHRTAIDKRSERGKRTNAKN